MPQPQASADTGARDWARRLASYRRPSHRRSATELAITAAGFALLWTLDWAALGVGLWWVSLLLAIPAGGMLVRLFLIQHDCGHGSFFRVRALNDWIGRVIGTLTLTPYHAWRQSHAIHHASSGNLDRRGVGDIRTLTIEEYAALNRWGRLRYRLYRHPVVMFGLGPAYIFLLQNRLPIGLMSYGWRPWGSAMGTNVAIAVLVGMMIWLVGLASFLIVHLPILVVAASAGVWLFFVQHQFEETYWAEGPEWQVHEAALHGSSHYVLPAPFRWITANIGLHHIHHLCSGIPFYRLPRVIADHPELGDIGRITFWQSLGCVRLTLWDSANRRLVSFREARHLALARQPALAPRLRF